MMSVHDYKFKARATNAIYTSVIWEKGNQFIHE